MSSQNLDQWKNSLEIEVYEIVRNKISKKFEEFEEHWIAYKDNVSLITSTGYKNPLVSKSISNEISKEPLEHVHIHDKEIKQHSTTKDYLNMIKSEILEIEQMVESIRLYLILLSPPKRTSSNLHASVQSEIAIRIASAINFLNHYLLIIENFHQSRASIIYKRSKIVKSQDIDQYLFEYDEGVAMSITKGFIEIQYILIFLEDLFEVCFLIKIIIDNLNSSQF